MKIYGQTFREVFAKLPWQYKIVVAVGSVFVVFVMIEVPAILLGRNAGPKAPVPGPLEISAAGGHPSDAMFDPSLAYDPQNQTVWLAYTSGENAEKGGSLVHVRLASSSAADFCKRWTATANGIAGKNDEILAPDSQTVLRTGSWRVETPTLVHDPDDRGHEWKLYAYKYFWADDPMYTLQVAQHYGMIVYKYATDPAKEWSTEQWLFSPAPDYPPPPYEPMVRLHLNRLDPSLEKVVAYSRPSAVYKDGALVMTLSAFTGGTTPDRVIMIVSLDHGNSWRYVGTLLQTSDLAAIPSDTAAPYSVLAGATLIEQAGQVYLAVVLGKTMQRGEATFIFGFDDFAKGLLQRDPKTGAPAVLHEVPQQTHGMVGGGFVAYSDACPLGMLTTEQVRGASNFRILKTYVNPVEKMEK